MAKSKVANSKPTKADKALSSVKSGAVIKSSQGTKAKSTKIAKETAKKANSKKIKEPESSDEDDSDSDSSDSSASESEDASSEKKGRKSTTNKKVNGTTKKTKLNESTDDSDEDSGDDSEDSDSEGQIEKPQINGKSKPNGAVKNTPKDDSDNDTSDESESSGNEEKAAKLADDSDESDDSSDGENPKSKAVSAKASRADVSDAESVSAESDSSSDSEDSSEDDKEAKSKEPKKRKAEDADLAESKKQKTGGIISDNPNATKNLFVGNLSWNVDEEWLHREFSAFGEIVRAKVITDRQSGRSKGFGYVEFTNLDDAIKAHTEMTGAQIDQRDVNVDFSQPRPENSNTDRQQRARSFGDKLSEPSDVLFVGNIAFGANEQMIGDAFGQHGSVMSVRLPTDPETGNVKGFGYVQFASVDDAKAALEAMKHESIAGRPLRLDFSAPRQNNREGGRGGFGGSGRGNGRGNFGGGRGRGGAPRGGRGGSTNRGGFGDFQGKKVTF